MLTFYVLLRLHPTDTLAHMSLDFQRLSQSFQSDTLHPVTSATLQRLHTAFCSLFYDTAASHVRDVDEMRMLACAVWHVFALPVEHGESTSPCLSHLATVLWSDTDFFLIVYHSARLHSGAHTNATTARSRLSILPRCTPPAPYTRSWAKGMDKPREDQSARCYQC